MKKNENFEAHKKYVAENMQNMSNVEIAQKLGIEVTRASYFVKILGGRNAKRCRFVGMKNNFKPIPRVNIITYKNHITDFCELVNKQTTCEQAIKEIQKCRKKAQKID